MSTPFGQIITAGVVRQAMRDMLTEHLPAVLEVVAQRSGYPAGQLLPPRGYGAEVDPDSVRDQPMGVIVCPGIASQPVRRSNGEYEMPWDVGVAVVVPGRSKDEAQALAEVYGAAVRAAVLQHPSLGGLAESTRWREERYEEIAFSTGMSVWAASALFGVTVQAAVDGYADARPRPVIERYINVFVSRDVLTGENQ